MPTLVQSEPFIACTEGTDNRLFTLGKMALLPEVTNYIRGAGPQRLGANRIFYVARCFRDETTTDAERLREFTQVGVEVLGDNALDCRKIARKDAITLFRRLLPQGSWRLEDGVPRGLNLYDDSGKAFEISAEGSRKQLLGGGPYEGGAGWALGLERLMGAMGRN